jgi:streptogramin lyase
MTHVRRLGGFVPFAAFLLLVTVLTSVPARAGSPSFVEYPIGDDAVPGGIVSDFGAVWVMDQHPNNKVLKLNPNTGQVLATYSSPVDGLHQAITSGLDYIWFAPEAVDDEFQEVIFRLNPVSGQITAFPLPTDGGPSRLTTGSGFVWATSVGRNSLLRLDPGSGAVMEYALSTPGSLPVGITVHDGDIWFTEIGVQMVGRLDPDTGVITEYPMGVDNIACCGIASAFGYLWYTANQGDVIGRMDPANGDTVETPVTPGSNPIEIVSDGSSLWFTELTGNRIGRMDPNTLMVTEFPVPSDDPGPFGITTGSVWFSAGRENSVWRLDVDSFDPVGLVDPSKGTWHLRDERGAETWFYYGNPGDVPFMGDWDCNGTDTPGLFRQSDAFAYLRNSNSQGIADIRFFFGNPSDIPLAGDFNGDGCDTLSIYRPSEARFYIMNKLGENEGGLGAAEYSFLFGNQGDKPVVGDWDGDGIDEIGLHRETTGFFYYRDTLTTGIADGQFYFGDPGDRFVSGDWGVIDGVDTPAVFRPSNTTFYFRYTLTQGNADAQFVWHGAGMDWLPVSGDFTLD